MNNILSLLPSNTYIHDSINLSSSKLLAKHKKRVNDEKFHYIHKSEFRITARLNDETSYNNWFNDIKTSLQTSKFKDYLVCDLVPVDGYDVEYNEKLSNANNLCMSSPEINQYLNEIVCFSIDSANLRNLISSGNTVNENFEILKLHFFEKINAFFLLNLESRLEFDPNNIIKFFKEIDTLSEIYHFIFREQATHELKLQWILKSLTKEPLNNLELVQEIQSNWEQITKNPRLIRTSLIKHSKLKIRLKKP